METPHKKPLGDHHFLRGQAVKKIMRHGLVVGFYSSQIQRAVLNQIAIMRNILYLEAEVLLILLKWKIGEIKLQQAILMQQIVQVFIGYYTLQTKRLIKFHLTIEKNLN